MEFNSPKAIFLQICDIVLDKILADELQNGNRIPSVRDLGETISVNPNTVQRAYSELQQRGIIEQQRGIGYFISHNGKELAQKMRRDEFMQIQLPLLIHQMKMLDISWNELQEIQQQLFKEKK